MYRKETHGLIKHIDFVILDMICLQIAFVLAYVIFGSRSDFNPYMNNLYRTMSVLIALVSFVVMFGADTLKSVIKRGYYNAFTKTVKHSLYTIGLSILLLYFSKDAVQYSRLIFGFTFVFYTIITYVVRVLWKKRLLRKMEDGGEKSLLVITNKIVAEKVIKNLKEKNYGRYLL